MSVLTSLQQSLHKAYVNTVSKVTPTLSSSKYLEEGVLTPDEFVEAGDLLTYKCPTWSWETGDASKAVNYLPKEKQYLLTRNVPCMVRVRSLEEGYKALPSLTIRDPDDDDGEDWVAPAPSSSGSEVVDITPDVSKLSLNPSSSSSIPSSSSSSSTHTTASTTTTTATTTKPDEDEDEDEDGEIPDMDNFENDDNLVDDDSATLQVPPVEEDNILKTRTYDLSITYDKYYQTPKLWLLGYDENKNPLKPEEIFQDISEDHAHKTIADIHPCRHATVMKKLIQRQVEAGRTPRLDQYLFLFLKFISAVIPTIEYDYTIEMDT